MYSLVPGPKLCLSESSYSVLIIQPELYTSKITFSGVFVMLKCHGTRNSYWVTGQEINSKQTHKIFFFPWEMGHAETVTQVLVRNTQTYYLLLMSCLNLPILKLYCLSITVHMPVSSYTLPGWKHCQLTLRMNNVTNLKPCPLAKKTPTFQGKWDESSIKMFRIFKSMPETTPA